MDFLPTQSRPTTPAAIDTVQNARRFPGNAVLMPEKQICSTCGYLHVVFTVPQELNLLTYATQRQCYNLLFHGVAETLKELPLDNTHLKARGRAGFFQVADYRDSSKSKVMTISAQEFIRRFLMHILPLGFMKIRRFCN